MLGPFIAETAMRFADCAGSALQRSSKTDMLPSLASLSLGLVNTG